MMKQQLGENKKCKAPKSWSQAEIMTTKMFKNHPGAPFFQAIW